LKTQELIRHESIQNLFTPGAPLPWENARVWAERFWASAAADERISPEFRQICNENRENLKKAGAGAGPRMIV
jgi:hypothetical protein